MGTAETGGYVSAITRLIMHIRARMLIEISPQGEPLMANDCRRLLFTLCGALCLTACITTSPVQDKPLSFTTLLSIDDPLIRSTVLIAGMAGSNFTFCNGVVIRPDVIATAGHCLMSDIDYFVLAPVKIQKEAPHTRVTFDFVPAERVLHHEQLELRFGGVVTNDIGLVRFRAKPSFLTQSAKLLPASESLKFPKSISWVETKDAHFRADRSNMAQIVSYKVERDAIVKEISLISDAATPLGRIPSTKAILIGINPGTTIHPGVSGSAVFYTHNGERYVIGLVSRFFLDLNLVSAIATQSYASWIGDSIEKLKP